MKFTLGTFLSYSLSFQCFYVLRWGSHTTPPIRVIFQRKNSIPVYNVFCVHSFLTFFSIHSLFALFLCRSSTNAKSLPAFSVVVMNQRLKSRILQSRISEIKVSFGGETHELVMKPKGTVTVRISIYFENEG